MNETSDDFMSSHPPKSYLEEMTFFRRFSVEMYTLVVIFNTVSNLLQIFVISKQKVLRSDLSFKNLVLINTTEIIFMLLTSSRLRIFMDFGNHITISSKSKCALENLEILCGFFVLILLNVSVIIWIIKNYSAQDNSNLERFSLIYKSTVTIALIASLILFAYAFHTCMRNFNHAWNVMLVFICGVLLVLQLIVVNTLRAFRAVFFKGRIKIIGQHNPGLAVANIFVITWSPSLLFMGIGVLWKSSDYYYVFSAILGLSSPIWIFAYLFWFNIDFNAGFKSMVRCRQIDASRNMEAFLVTYSRNDSIQSTFQT